MFDGDIRRIKQPHATRPRGRRRVNADARHFQRALARGFNQSAIPALLTPPSRNTPISPRRVIRPDNHPTAVTVHLSIGLNGRLCPKVSNGCILNIRVLALVIAPHAHRAAAPLARSINRGLVRQRHSIAQNIHRTTRRSGSDDLAGTFNIRIASRLEHDLAAFQRGGAGLDQAAVP